MINNIIFDGDDTLWMCGKYYVAVREEMSKYQEQRTGIPAAICDKILNDIDISCTKLPNAFAKERYPRSFAATSAALDLIRGMEPNMDAIKTSYQIGNEVFDAPFELYPDVIHMLAEYRASGKRMFLLTKGPEDVQRRKIVMHGLDKIFDADKIYIVPKKTVDEMEKIRTDHNLIPTETIMVGDSMKDDMGSALAAGFHTAYIHKPNEPKWAYDDQSHLPTYWLEHVTELPALVRYE